MLLPGNPSQAGMLLFVHTQACLPSAYGDPQCPWPAVVPSLPCDNSPQKYKSGSPQVHVELLFTTDMPPTLFSLDPSPASFIYTVANNFFCCCLFAFPCSARPVCVEIVSGLHRPREGKCTKNWWKEIHCQPSSCSCFPLGLAL